MKSISARDVVLLHNKYLVEIKDHVELRNKNKRQLYFLAACSIFDNSIDPCVALKLRPHGGLIGIDDSSLDSFLKFSKVFRLHAILHDAAGFVKEHSGKGPGYFYFANCCGLSSCYIGHISGLFFCLYIKFFKPLSFKQLEC